MSACSNVFVVSSRRFAAFLSVAAVLVLALVQGAGAVAISFTVHAGQEETRIVNLAVNDHVAIRFTVTGQGSSVLDFYLTDPSGAVQESLAGAGYADYSFVCSRQGDYTMHFSNVDSSVDKVVSLDYEVDHYILGMPQMLFLTLVILGICLVMVAVFVLMGRPRFTT